MMLSKVSVSGKIAWKLRLKQRLNASRLATARSDPPSKSGFHLFDRQQLYAGTSLTFPHPVYYSHRSNSLIRSRLGIQPINSFSQYRHSFLFNSSTPPSLINFKTLLTKGLEVGLGGGDVSGGFPLKNLAETSLFFKGILLNTESHKLSGFETVRSALAIYLD